MKKFLKNNSTVLILSLVIVFVFVFGGIFSRYMTSQIDVHAEEKAIEDFNNDLLSLVSDGTSVEKALYESLDLDYLIPGTEEFYTPELIDSYKVLNDNDEEIAVIYIIETYGRFSGVEVAYAIDISTNTLLDLLVLNNFETPEYFQRLGNDFYSQFVDKTLDDAVFTIDAVAGSTYSSTSFEDGMNYARELYARDYNFEIPNIIYQINDVERNFDSTTFLAKPYIVDITYGVENNSLVAYFDNEFNLVEVISGTAPDQTYLDLFKNDLPDTDFIDVSTYITDYDSDLNKITIETIAYGGKPITVVFELNSALDKVVGMTIQTTQSYDNEYNSGYTGGAVPAVENAYRDQYLLDGTYIDAFASATITSNAMVRIFTLADEVVTELSGGGN